MKVFAVSIISLCYLLTAYATGEECKPEITNLQIIDDYQISVEFESCLNVHSAQIKCVIGEEIIYKNTSDNTGIIDLTNRISCEDDAKISVEVYDEDGLSLGESIIADVIPCGDCKAIQSVSYDGDLKMTVLMTPPQPECIAKKFQIKLTIFSEIKYIDISPEESHHVITLSSELPCKAEVSVIGLGYNNLQLTESTIKTFRKAECEDCSATIVSVDYDEELLQIIASLTPPSSKCIMDENFRLEVRCSIAGEIVSGDVFVDNTVGIVKLSSSLSCKDVKLFVVSYQESWYDEIVGESDTYDLLQCQECKPKVAGVTSDGVSVLYVSITPPSSDCDATQFDLKTLNENVECTIILNNTVGICPLPSSVNHVTAYINAYNEENTIIGKSDYFEFDICRENCKAKIVGARYDGFSRIYATITMPTQEKCTNAAGFKLKYTIDGEIHYVDAIDTSVGMIQLAKPITDEDIKISAITYDENGVKLGESHEISPQLQQCLS